MQKKTKKIMIALSVLLAVLVAVGTFLTVWFFGASYPQFDAIARAEFPILGGEELAPQGLCPLPEDSGGYDFAMSGYVVDDTPSRVYLINSRTEEGKFFTVQENGKESTAHFGGITCTENHLYLTSGSRLLRLSLREALAVQNGGKVNVQDSVEVGIKASFCYYTQGSMFVGEFYRSGNYETPESHHRPVAGGTNYAYVYQFDVDEGQTGGLASDTPKAILSVREQVQGIALSQDKIVLSTSYGLANSRLFSYSNPLAGERTDAVTVNGTQVPLYALDGDNLLLELEMPSFSEEVCIKGDRVYILYESTCKKYKYFARRALSHVYSIALSDLK